MSSGQSHKGVVSQVGAAILSRSGGAIFIGVLGFLSGIAGLFVDGSTQLSVKWFFLETLISITVIVILLNLLAQKLTEDDKYAAFDEVPIALRGDSLLIVKRNNYLSNLIVVAGYTRNTEFEDLAFIGTVVHIQEKAVQVEIVASYNGFVANQHYRDVVVRPVVPKQFVVELLAASARTASVDLEDPIDDVAPPIVADRTA